ncbi:MAG: alpha/beta fold hydrolase [Cyanobacteriota bacterium]
MSKYLLSIVLIALLILSLSCTQFNSNAQEDVVNQDYNTYVEESGMLVNSLNGEDVGFLTTDKFAIKGTFYQPESANDKKAPVIILLPMLGKTRETYKPMIPYLLKNGLNVLAIDFRGHGESIYMDDDTQKDYKQFTNQDWQNLPLDVDAAIQFLSEEEYVDANKIALIGASIGANTAIISNSKHPDKVKLTVALSPGLDYKGLKPGDYISSIKNNIDLVAAKDDSYSCESVEKLSKEAYKAFVIIFPEGGHGTDLFKSHPDLIVNFSNSIAKELKKN